MNIQRLRKKLKSLDTAKRIALAKRTGIGVATIHRIANSDTYMPSMRTFFKLTTPRDQSDQSPALTQHG